MKLHIKNFQSIKLAELVLGQFTALVGPSNTGKSAVIRSIKSLMTNARGQDFITRGESSASVTLLLDDNHGVAWQKGSGSKYVLDGVVFDKVGTSVPAPVAATLGMPDISIGTVVENVNVRMQFDGPFFVSATGPARFKLLSYLSGSESIAAAIAVCNKERLRATRGAEDTQLMLDAAVKVLDRKSDLDALEAQFDAVSSDFSKFREDSALLEHLKILSSQQSRLVETIDSLDISLVKIEPILTKMQVIADYAEKKIADFTRLANTYKSLVALYNSYKNAEAALAKVDIETKDCDIRIASLQAELHNSFGMLDFCPLCGQPIKKGQ